jgi:hypothetical protein
VVLFFFFVGDGDGEAAVAAVVDVPVVPCCVQETINARPIRMVINDKTDFFIDVVKVNGSRMPFRSMDARKYFSLNRTPVLKHHFSAAAYLGLDGFGKVAAKILPLLTIDLSLLRSFAAHRPRSRKS